MYIVACPPDEFEDVVHDEFPILYTSIKLTNLVQD